MSILKQVLTYVDTRYLLVNDIMGSEGLGNYVIFYCNEFGDNRAIHYIINDYTHGEFLLDILVKEFNEGHSAYKDKES